MSRIVACLLTVCLASVSGALHAAEPSRAQSELLVFAAASLTDALREVGEAYTARTGHAVTFSFASSSILARQIEAGARAQVFVSADAEWMDYLAAKDLIDASTRRNVAGNRLVLIANRDVDIEVEISPGFPLARALGRGRLAIGDPVGVPAGRYAQAALVYLNVWDDVAGRLVPSENVRTALTFVARGEVPLGIVYATDARLEERVRVVDTFPEEAHEPIVYPAAAVRGASEAARAFVAFLGQEIARDSFRKHGFQPVTTPSN